jgi:hypothetical protein
VAGPLLDLVRFDGVDQVGAAVLQRDGVPVVVVHLGEQIGGIRVEWDERVVQNAQRVQLAAKSGFADNELGSVRSAIYN